MLNSLQPAGRRLIVRVALSLALSSMFLGCAEKTSAPASAAMVMPEAGSGQLSILIGPGVDPDLGHATVYVDGKVLGYLDTSCGLIAAAASGPHEIVVEWDTARIIDVLNVPKDQMTSVMISSDLKFVPTDPVEREAPSCRG